MVGLGEERNEVQQLMDDLRTADVDFLTIGQYLQPTKKHHPVIRFVPPEEFKSFETDRLLEGFPDGLGQPADAILAPCRRRFRAASKAAREAKVRAAFEATGADMPKFKDTTSVPHSAAQMFDLVADIERYPEFLPMCEALKCQATGASAAA